MKATPIYNYSILWRYEDAHTSTLSELQLLAETMLEAVNEATKRLTSKSIDFFGEIQPAEIVEIRLHHDQPRFNAYTVKWHNLGHEDSYESLIDAQTSQRAGEGYLAELKRAEPYAVIDSVILRSTQQYRCPRCFKSSIQLIEQNAFDCPNCDYSSDRKEWS